MAFKKHRIIAQLTVSIYTDVMAVDEESAIDIAKEADMMPIIHDGSEDPLCQWIIDELDGEPENLIIEKC